MANDERDPQGEIPPLHVLEAMHEQDKKATEELLAGFDRPGRTPRRSPSQRDFVDYYANKEPAGRMPPPRTFEPEPIPHEKPTLVLGRTRKLRAVIVWAAAACGMVLFGAVVAILVTPDAPDPRAPAAVAPSAATTVTSASAAPVETTLAPTVIAEPAVPPKAIKPPPAKAIASSASTAAATTIKTAPRDDFIRDL